MRVAIAEKLNPVPIHIVFAIRPAAKSFRKFHWSKTIEDSQKKEIFAHCKSFTKKQQTIPIFGENGRKKLLLPHKTGSLTGAGPTCTRERRLQ